jgi:hypothetical protein
MVRKAFLALAVCAVLSVFGGLADSAVAISATSGGAVTPYIPPRCC